MVFSGSDHRTSDFLELLQKERPELLSRSGTGAFGTTPSTRLTRCKLERTTRANSQFDGSL